MSAMVDVQTPPASMPGSYFAMDYDHPYNHHMAYDSIFKPPAPSPRPTQSRTPSHYRPRPSRHASSIPRPVSRAGKDNESARKRPRLDVHSSTVGSTFSVISVPTTPQTGSRPQLQTSDSFSGIVNSRCDQSYFSVADSARSRDAFSPPPFVNTSYKLAGGLDTPNASYQRRLDEWGDQQEELDWRVNRYAHAENSADASTNWSASMETAYHTAAQSQSQLPRTPSSPSGQGQKRSLEDSPQFKTPFESPSKAQMGYSATGWHIRSRAWAVTGGLAFKAINFCWNTAFRGFSAGEGQSYAMDLGTPDVPNQTFRLSQVAAQDDVFSNQYERQDAVPGGFSDREDYFGKGADLASGREVSTPTTQGQHDDLTLEMKSDWTMVEKPSDAGSSIGPASRRRSQASVAGFRSGSFRNSAGSKTVCTSATGASFASPRSRSVTGPSTLQQRTSSASISGRHERSGVSTRPTLSAASPYRRQSSNFTVQLSPMRTKPQQSQSPSMLSPEVAKYEKKMRKRAKAEDESMARMNAHLQDLIRQGKEALGSHISIKDDDDDDDEGFYEDASDEDRGLRRAW